MKKDQILEAASKLFAERGFSRTSTAMLAREAGVAEGTLFRHFKSKDDIFIVLIQRLREKITQDVYQYLEVQGSETGIELIVDIIKACYVFVRKNRIDFAIILRDAPGCYGEPDSPAFEHSKVIYVLLQENFQRAIEKGQEEGNIRPSLHPGDTACLLASSLVGLMRVVHLGFLNPSEDMLKNLVLCTRAMLENPNN